MPKLMPVLFTLIVNLLVIIPLAACQVIATAEPTPIPTKTSVPTPTITPTPQTQILMIPQVKADCGRLDELDIPVSVSGVVSLPDIIYGYEGWYGMELVTQNTLRVLVPVGEGNNTMDDVPELFSAKDLVIRDSNGAIIRDGHSIEVTGKLKYRAGNSERECELFVEKITTRTSPDLLVPVEKGISELTQLPVEECLVLEESGQLVRVKGTIGLDTNKSRCTLGTCALLFSNGSDSMLVNVGRGGGANSMETLPPAPVMEDIRLLDRDGQLVEGTQVILTGTIHCQIVGCDMIVYEIEGVTE